MSDTVKLDLAQRIAEALSRTSEPRATGGELELEESQQVIGKVPVHLRHLHNLLFSMREEVAEASEDLSKKEEELDAASFLFFFALREHFSKPENSLPIFVCNNWDVVADFMTEHRGRSLNDLFD
jgi:hypothetical protein